MHGKRRNKSLTGFQLTKRGRPAGRPFLLSAVIAGLAMLAGALPARAASRGLIITSFDAVRVEAPVRVLIDTGRGVTARGEGPDDAFDRLSLDVSGQLLTIRLRTDGNSAPRRAAQPMTLYLSTGMVRRVSVNGGAEVRVSGIRAQQAVLALSGTGSLIVDRLDTDQLSVLMAGAGRIGLSGRSGKAALRLLGPGLVEAEGFTARDLLLTNTGPGKVTVSASSSASITSSGSGDSLVVGPAACKVRQTGLGRVTCGGADY